MQDQRNLILAITLSLLVLFGYQYLQSRFVHKPPAMPPIAESTNPAAPAMVPNSPAPTGTVPAGMVPAPGEVLPEAARIPIDTPRLKGSISLAGGRIDDLVLSTYYETTAHDKPVRLLSPAGAAQPYFVEFGWTVEPGAASVPTAKTIWTSADDQALTPDAPVTLTWDNGAGLVFQRIITVDRNYLFTVTQKVTNHRGGAITLRPYGTIVRFDPPVETKSFGPAPSVAGMFGAGVEESSYKDISKEGLIPYQATGGWVSMNDKYWLVAAVPPKDEAVAYALKDTRTGDSNRYSADYQGEPQSVAPGQSTETTTLLFAGAKEQDLLESYQDTNGIDKLERTIDFGWLYILAKPFFIALDFIARQVGNFGIAILLFNIILKIILFPLQDRSFHQMARMKDLQPKIAALKERFGEDKERMAKEQMELFKREKINPAAGCVPLLVQLPIFYALYRVLSTTIEMRQAPFFGWIHDLSAPDPTNIFNLFGLIPWEPFAFLPHLGIWPLIYGGTMWLQQKMTPTPTTDPMQARVMNLMPLIFMFFFAGFPAGLTIYYSWNAVLTIAQMALIRRRAEGRKAAAAAKEQA